MKWGRWMRKNSFIFLLKWTSHSVIWTFYSANIHKENCYFSFVSSQLTSNTHEWQSFLIALDHNQKMTPPKKQQCTIPANPSLIPERRSHNLSTAWQTNTATSMGLRLRLNTPANFKDTATYSPQTHISSLLQTDHPSSFSSPANQPEETISWLWAQMNGISGINVFNKNNKHGCLSHKALMEIDLSQRHKARQLRPRRAYC